MFIRNYNVSDLKKVVKESKNEFKPVLGNNVERDNKKINDKAYKDMEKATKDYDGNVKNSDDKSHKVSIEDRNKGMQDLRYDSINKDFQKRVKSQMKGYTSAEDEKLHKNDEHGNADYHEIDGMEEKAKKFADIDAETKALGITGREIGAKNFRNLRKTAFDEGKLHKLMFKNTVFLSEEHMVSRIPDDYKVEGRKFIMRDKNNTEYLVEWHTEEEPKIVNETKFINDSKRIKELFNYKSSDSKTTVQGRMNENNTFSDILNKARMLAENKNN